MARLSKTKQLEEALIKKGIGVDEVICEVMFKQGVCVVEHDFGEYDQTPISFLDEYTKEIVGNIFDNP